MRTVGIICPNCFEITQYDCASESAQCKFCKQPIKTKGVDADPQRKEKLATLRKELDSLLEEGFDEHRIKDVTNRILGLDVGDSDAWIYKGMASDKMATKLTCYFNCARHMDLSEYEDLYDTMAEDISSSIYMTCDEDWSALDVAYIDVMLGGRNPERNDEFLMEVIGRLHEIILNSEDTYHAKVSIDWFMRLSVSTLVVYCGLAEQKAVLDKILGYLDEFASRFKKFKIEERRGYNNKSISDRLKTDKKFMSKLASHIGNAAKWVASQDEKKEEYDSFWLTEDIVPFVKPVLESYELNEKMFDAGFGETNKLAKEQTAAMEYYVSKYLLKGKEKTYKQ